LFSAVVYEIYDMCIVLYCEKTVSIILCVNTLI